MITIHQCKQRCHIVALQNELSVSLLPPVNCLEDPRHQDDDDDDDDDDDFIHMSSPDFKYDCPLRDDAIEFYWIIIAIHSKLRMANNMFAGSKGVNLESVHIKIGGI